MNRYTPSNSWTDLIFAVKNAVLNYSLLFRTLIFSCLPFALTAQFYPAVEKKVLDAERVFERPVIDGVLSEAVWHDAPIAESFVELEPVPGRKPRFPSEIRVLYDDHAVYIGARLYDPSPDSILKELSPRDQIGNTDWFVVQFDTYKTGQIAFDFLITASGVQVDRRVQAPNKKDHSWDAVWMSSVRMDSLGWVVELEIPYSALRFSSKDIQEWGINFGRYVRRFREEYWWNPINPGISNRLHQNGILANIEGIKAPPRISATPFIVNYLNHDARNAKTPWQNDFNAGLDVKIGLTDAFTMDIALVPDFGQVRFDDQVLNLTPFEIQFDDNRPFFTEGTELFNRGDVFYSRRIGAKPFYLRNPGFNIPGQEPELLPQVSPLINATKFSGRTNNGLGIGVFNALENRLFTQPGLADPGQENVLINPLTNYNIIVLDQNLKNNSYISLINTNVWREGHAYDANVSGTEFALRDKANAWMVQGTALLSNRFLAQGNDQGHRYSLGVEKTKGNIQYALSYRELSDTYNPNDLGFLLRNNERTATAVLRYNIFSPWWFLNYANMSLQADYQRLYRPDVFSRFAFNYNSFFMTRDFFAFSVYAVLEPVNNQDYFEPRTRDFSKFYNQPSNYLIGGFISTDYRKKFAYDLNGSYKWWDESGRQSWFLRFSPRVRVSDHFFFQLSSSYHQFFAEAGFVPARQAAVGFNSLEPGSVVFARRDQQILDHTLSARYNFNPLNNITLRLRHYWTRVDFNSFYTLNDAGNLSETSYLGRTESGDLLHSLTYNLFNIDLVYTWRFAPGSDLVLVWKNAITTTYNLLDLPYTGSYGDLLSAPQFNSFSLKMIYYLDYHMTRQRFGKTT